MKNQDLIKLFEGVAKGEITTSDATLLMEKEKIGVVYRAYLDSYDNKREIIFAREGWTGNKEKVLPCIFSTLLYVICEGITIKADVTRYYIAPDAKEAPITKVFKREEVMI